MLLLQGSRLRLDRFGRDVVDVLTILLPRRAFALIPAGALVIDDVDVAVAVVDNNLCRE